MSTIEEKGQGTSTTTTERTSISTKDRCVAKISPKLAGQHNYAVWIWNLECALTAYDIAGSGEGESEEDDYIVWDLVVENYQEPDPDSNKRNH